MKEHMNYTARDNLIKALHIFWKYKANIIIICSVMTILILFTQFANTYIPGWIVDLLSANKDRIVIWEKIIPVVIIVGLSELCIELLKHKLDLSYQYICHKVSLDIKKIQLYVDYSLLEKEEFQNKMYEAIRCTETWGGKRVLTSVADDFFGVLKALGGFVLFALLLSSVHPIIAFLLIVAPIIPYMFVKNTHNYENKNREKWTKLDKIQWYILYAAEKLEYGKDIRMYSLKNWLLSVYYDQMEKRKVLDRVVFRKKVLADFVDLLIILLRDGLCYIVLLNKVVKGEITPGYFVIVFAAISNFSNCVNEIVKNCGELKRDLLAINSLNVFLSAKNDLEDLESDMGVSDGELVINNLSFSYDESEDCTIKPLNLKINKGEKIALIGANGAGKSTLIKLICGLYHPIKGEMHSGDIYYDMSEVKRWQSMFSCLFQDISVLPYTFAEIVSATTIEETDIDKVKMCLESVGLMDVISRFHNGIYEKYNKSLNESGKEMSGGEKQKLLLARTLYRDAPIIILDEPTSALDPIAEEELYKIYNDLLKDKTMIFVSHRLSSTRFCDRILFMEKGVITEQGTFSELMKKNGKYAKMFEAQAKYYTESIDEGM